MTAAALGLLHIVAAILAGLLLTVIFLFIAAVCIWCVMRPRVNGYARRLRLPKNRRPRRTLILTPDHKHPDIIGDVSQAQWPRAHYPASRANMRGEG